MKNHLTLSLFFLMLIFLSSCFPSYMSRNSNPNQVIESKFVEAKSVGMTKREIIEKFGTPINTSLKKENDITIEELHYLESFGTIRIVTSITLHNGVAIKQDVKNITSNYDERFDAIDYDLKILMTS